MFGLTIKTSLTIILIYRYMATIAFSKLDIIRQSWRIVPSSLYVYPDQGYNLLILVPI